MRTYSCQVEIRVRHTDPEETWRLVRLLLDDGLRGLESSGEARFIARVEVRSVDELADAPISDADGEIRPPPNTAPGARRTPA
jgi:hypothetical protein